jgi:hypothetical protein
MLNTYELHGKTLYAAPFYHLLSPAAAGDGEMGDEAELILSSEGGSSLHSRAGPKRLKHVANLPMPSNRSVPMPLSGRELLSEKRRRLEMRKCSIASETIAWLSLGFCNGTFCHALVSASQTGLPETSSVIVMIKSHQSGIMPPTMIGIKSGKTEFGKTLPFFTDTNSGAVNDLKTLSPLPGQSCVVSIGSDGDVLWVPNGPAKTPGQISRADIDALASFLKAAGCKLDYTASILKNTPSSAADELSYVDSAVGDALLAVGFGNEPDVAPYTLSAVPYAQEWNTFANAALARDPNLRFKGPDTGIVKNLGVWLSAWYKENSSLPLAYGTQHFYVGGPNACPVCTESLMLGKRSLQASWDAMVTQKVKFEAGLPKILPVLLTETNSFYGGGDPGISNSYGSALYAFDFIFQAAEAGFAGTAFSMLDHWTEGYSPLNIVNGHSYGVKPEYYGLYLAALAGYGPMLSTVVENAGGLHGYTVADIATGTLNTAFINTTNSNFNVHATYPAGTELKACSSYVMSDSAGITDTVGTDLNIQGGHFDSNTNIALQSPYPVFVDAATADLQVPAYSGVLVKCTH